MGEDGLLGLWKERVRLLPILTEKLRIFASLNGEKLLISPRNSISVGVSCDSLCGDTDNDTHIKDNDHVDNNFNNSSNNNEITDINSSIGSSNNNENKNDIHRDIHNNNSNKNGHNNDYNDNIKKNGDSNGSSSSSNSANSVSFLGAMLFQRNVSGCRVIQQTSEVTNIESIDFTSWGAHKSNYPISYFTAACTIGLTELEINLFIDRLNKVWKKYEKSDSKKLNIVKGVNIPQPVNLKFEKSKRIEIENS
jgi:hypothetical protein